MVYSAIATNEHVYANILHHHHHYQYHYHHHHHHAHVPTFLCLHYNDGAIFIQGQVHQRSIYHNTHTYIYLYIGNKDISHLTSHRSSQLITHLIDHLNSSYISSIISTHHTSHPHLMIVITHLDQLSPQSLSDSHRLTRWMLRERLAYWT